MESKSNTKSLFRNIGNNNYYQTNFLLVQLNYPHSKTYFYFHYRKKQIKIFFH
jgi:hypothetical protein